MDLSADQIELIEEALKALDELDAAEVPAPAAELADLLESILDETEPI